MRRLTLTHWILIATLAGAVVGYLDFYVWTGTDLAATLRPFASIFIRLIKSLVAPLIFATLVIGIAGQGDDVRQIGRVALRALIYFQIVTTLALVIGMAAAHLGQPGAGLSLAESATAGQQFAGTQTTWQGVLEHAVPASIVDAMARNETLQIVFFALLFGAALTQVRGRPREVMLEVCESLAEVMFKFTNLVMLYAPVGVAAAVSVAIGTNGLGVVVSLGKLVLTLYAALIVFVLVVLLPAALIARLPIGRFWRASRQPTLIAFTTASSEAALPRALENMEQFGVPRRIASFVLPTGYSFNLAGSTLYLGLASIFVAQAAGITLSFGTQVTMVLTLMLTSKGVAGVPRASLVILSGTLSQFGLPLEGIAVILAVDVFMDMARTAVNVLGNCLATAVVARWDGVLEERS
ncbi:MAG: dicarboxylate/amino acid:cation symporter [Gemmatimonadales bacterium]